MKDKIIFEQCSFGMKAIIISEWNDSFLELINNNNVTELELNDGKGWRGSNLDFLVLLPNLKSLIVIDLKIESLNSIHYLNKLEKIDIITYAKTPINFKSFPNLLECNIEWIKGSESLFELTKIRRLFINNYKGKDSSVLSRMLELEELSLLNTSFNEIKGILFLKELKKLKLASLKKINSLEGIGKLKKIKELEVQNCKSIFDVSPIFELINIERLLLVDLNTISSIKGIEKLVLMRYFLFYGSTDVIDGDISSLFLMKQIRKISFQNRKHYSHKREEFEQYY